MKRILFCLLILNSPGLFSQNKTIDSLTLLLKTSHEDTNRVFLLNKLVSQYSVIDPQKALEASNKMLQLSEKINDKYGAGNSLYLISNIYLKQKKYHLAETYGIQSLQIARQISYLPGIRNTSEILSEVYYKTSNYKKCLEMLELFKLMADSINNAVAQNAALKKQIQYDFDKKEAETKAEQEKKDVIFSENLKKQKLKRDYFIAGFGLILLLAIFIFRSYRQKHKANIIIISKKSEAEKQKNIIEVKQKEILDSIRYAKRIQNALLPTEMTIKKNLNRLMRK